MSTEDKKEVAEKEDSTLKKMKIMAKKELKRVTDKGRKLAKQSTEYIADNAISTGVKTVAVAAAMSAMAPTESNAQTYQQFRNSSTELHIGSDGSVSMRQNGSASAGRTASFTQVQRQQVLNQQEMYSYVNVVGEHVSVPAQFRYKDELLTISPQYTFGLYPDYVGAYLDVSGNKVYFAREALDGALDVYMVRARENVNVGDGPYKLSLKEREKVLHGRGRPGGVVYGGGVSRNRTLDKINQTMDQVDYAIATASRIGETAGDILHIGNEIGGYIKHEIKRGRAPSGPHRSPSGRTRGSR